MLVCSAATGQTGDLVIDSFQYATPAEAQANWIAASAGQPALPVTEVQVPCLSLPLAFTTTTVRGYWDRIMNLDLSPCSWVTMRLKSTRPSMVFTLYFQTTGGGWYTKFFNITDQWKVYAFPLTSFGTEGTVGGWNTITRIRLSPWQGSDPTPATVYVSDLIAGAGVINLLPNSGFEVTTAESMPDYWGPASGSWGTAVDQWVLDTDSWRARWGVDRTVNHTPGGTNSLRIVSSITPPATTPPPELKAVANWTQLPVNRTSTLSVWLRSDTSNLPVTLQVLGCTPSASTSVTTPATPYTWQRYSVSVTPTASTARVTCLIFPTGNGTLWVDDAQLEDGAAATEWRASLTDPNLMLETVHKVVPPIGDVVVTPGGSSVAVSIDSNRRFLVDGQPFIPMAVGWEAGPTSPAVARHLAQAGFNTIVPLLRSTHTISDIRAFLDAATASGLKVIFWADRNVPIATLESWIVGLKDHPALIMWYVYDEPTTSAEWQEANDKYNLARTTDPNRPAMVNVTGRSVDISQDWASDVLSMDNYPIGSPSGGSITEFGVKVETLSQVAAAAGKPSWSWLQNMGYAYFCSREPTGAEAECMAYLTLIHGSRGIMYFSQKPRTIEQWNELRLLTDEVNTLTPALSSTDTAPTVSASSPSIHLLSKSYGGRNYVIAVNESPLPVTATLTSSAAVSVPATVLFENRNVGIVNGGLTDTFAGYQRHVYSSTVPVAHWKLDETSGVTAADSSGNLNTGTLTNGPAWSTAGRIGGSLNFDGKNDYVNVPNSAGLNPTSQITICFWLKAPSSSYYGMMVSKDYNAQFGVMWSVTSGRIRFDLRPWFSNSSQFVSNGELSYNQWHHVACTFDGQNAKIYLDGMLDKVSPTVSGAISTSTSALNIGRGNGNKYPYKGQLDDVRVFNYALTADEISALSAAP
jgi:hypothetical protein